MSVARSTSRPGRSASLAPMLATTTRWLAWNSVSIRFHSASMSGSTGAAARMTSNIQPMRSLTARAPAAPMRSCRSGSGSSSTARYHSRWSMGTSSWSPRSRKFHSARSTPLLVSKAR